MEFPNPDNSLSGGMTGTAKIKTGSRPIAWQAEVAPLGIGCDPKSGGDQDRDFHVAKRKGRRSWDGGPSGLLLLQTPGPAERRVGRSLKFRSKPIAYHFTVKLRTDIRGVLRSSFLARLGFLALLHWFRGRIHCSSSSAELSYRSSGSGSAIRRPKRRSLVSSENKPLARELDCSDPVFSCSAVEFSESSLNYSTIRRWLASFLAPETSALLV